MPREIIIEISEDGKEVTIEAFGYKGKGCAADVLAYAQALGKSSAVNHKREYYQLRRTVRGRRRARLRGMI